MKYIMLIYQGTALETQAALSEAEQKQVYADYGVRKRPSGWGARSLNCSPTTPRFMDCWR